MKKAIRNFYKGIFVSILAGMVAGGWYMCYNSVPSQVRLTTQNEFQAAGKRQY